MLFRCASALAILAIANAGSSSSDENKISWDDIKVTNCVNGKCTSEWAWPSDEDLSTDCFTVKDSVWVNEYKEIDFANHYKPSKSYTCIYMTGGTYIGKQGFGESIFDTFVMTHTVTNVEKMAFKKVKTNTGKSMKLIQMCNPVTRTYTNVTFDERWNEETDPPAEIIKECPIASAGPEENTSTSAGKSASVEVGTLAAGLVGLIGAGMM